MAAHVQMLMEALDFIEENLTVEIDVENVASHLYVSVSSLQKTFKYAFHMYVKEYIIRRRFTCAANDILHTNNSITEISIKYGYSSAESFTRGFKKIWGITPSEYRKTRTFAGLTPKLALPVHEIKEASFMSVIKYDMTELVEILKSRRNNAYVLADLGGLMEINEKYGRDAGDAALLELIKRVEEACSDDDILLRIGGDEFVVFTDSEDLEHAADIVVKVGGRNGEIITVGDNKIPIHIHVGSFLGFPNYSDNDELIVEIKNRINMIKQV